MSAAKNYSVNSTRYSLRTELTSSLFSPTSTRISQRAYEFLQNFAAFASAVKQRPTTVTVKGRLRLLQCGNVFALRACWGSIFTLRSSGIALPCTIRFGPFRFPPNCRSDLHNLRPEAASFARCTVTQICPTTSLLGPHQCVAFRRRRRIPRPRLCFHPQLPGPRKGGNPAP